MMITHKALTLVFLTLVRGCSKIAQVNKAQFLFLVRREPEKKACNQCGKSFEKGELCYSRRRKKYYCSEDAFLLGYITGTK